MTYPDLPSSPRPRLTGGWGLLIMFIVGYLVAQSLGPCGSRRLRDPRAEPKPIVPRGKLADDERSTVDLFREHAPAVVFITTARIGFDIRRFNERSLSQEAGSGFVWTTDGYIVTNDHVISDSDFAQVTLFDQSVWEADVVGRASSKDLAVLKIDAPPDRLQPILVGESKNLQVGQKVFAIGNPFGLDQTLTTGIISALDREISAKEMENRVQAKRTIDGVIQTDAAINPGNSGGPLLDSHGRLIGVNTAIYSPSGAYAGVGFAIPVDTINRIVPQLIRHGRLIRPEIGIIAFQDHLTRQQGLSGVLVRQVDPGSPAEEAEIQATELIEYSRGFRVYRRIRLGDLIVEGDGEPIEDLDDWYTFLEKHRVGDEVTLRIIRDLKSPQQRKLTVPIKLIGPER